MLDIFFQRRSRPLLLFELERSSLIHYWHYQGAARSWQFLSLFVVCWRLEVILPVFSSHTRTGRGGLASSWLEVYSGSSSKPGSWRPFLASLPLNSMCHEGAVQNNENRITYKAPSPYPLSVSELHTCAFDSHGAGYLCTVFLRVLCAFLTPHCSVSQELDLSFLVYSTPHFMVQR